MVEKLHLPRTGNPSHGRSKGRIEFEGAAGQPDRLGSAFLGRFVHLRQRAQIEQALGGGQQGRIDDGGAERHPDGPHRPAHRLQESRAGVLHQMPAIGNLHGLRCRSGRGLTIAAGAPATRCAGSDTPASSTAISAMVNMPTSLLRIASIV